MTWIDIEHLFCGMIPYSQETPKITCTEEM